MFWAAKSDTINTQHVITYGGASDISGSTFRLGLSGCGGGPIMDVSDGVKAYSDEITAEGWHFYTAIVPAIASVTLNDVMLLRVWSVAIGIMSDKQFRADNKYSIN